MTVPHSYKAKAIGTKGLTTPLTNEAMERCGELPTVEHMYGYMVAHAMDLEERLAAATSSTGPEGEAEAACAAMVKWCDKNDWGSVPKKLEERLRNACRATQDKGGSNG
jgi:hypothetical protein